MNIVKYFAALTVLSLLLVPFRSDAFSLPPQQELHNGLSLQGFTGILNVPSAHVTTEGDLYALYTNQIERKWRSGTPYQDNYLFSAGFFSIIEVGGRLTWAPQVDAKDLSGNLKFTSEPFFRKYPYIPVMAFGLQDVGGGAPFFRTKYAVISEDIYRLRLTAGYGTGPDRMKGAFAGGEIKALEWIYLLADYDTKETNVGVRAVLPHFWKIPVSFTATAKTSLDHKPGNIDIAFGFSLPMGFQVRESSRQIEPKPTETEKRGEESSPTLLKTPEAPTGGSEIKTSGVLPGIEEQGLKKTDLIERDSQSKTSNSGILEALRDRLIMGGFLNIRVGEKTGKTLVIEYENNMFNHNEMDAMGVVFGIAATSISNFDNLQVIVKRKNIRMMQMTVPFATLKAFIANERKLDDLKAEMVISSKIDSNSETTFVGGDENSNLLATSLMVWPGTTMFLGSDYSPLDYEVSLIVDSFTDLWSGAVLNARWNEPLFWSENFNRPDAFKGYRSKSELNRLMFFQGIKLLPDVMLGVAGGMIAPDLYGTLNELTWKPGDGSNSFWLVQTWAHNEKNDRLYETFLATYEYYYAPLDTSLKVRGGQFASRDRGYLVELSRLFRDTTLSFYYKNTTTKNDDRGWHPPHLQAAGFEFTFPLTPRKDMKNYYKMQVRGTDNKVLGAETILASTNEFNMNFVPNVPIALTPRFSASLYFQYLNKGRLSEVYIKSNLARLREAWLNYCNEF